MDVHAWRRQHMGAVHRHALSLVDGRGIAMVDPVIIPEVEANGSAIVGLHRLLRRLEAVRARIDRALHDPHALPGHRSQLLRRELQLFPDWCVAKEYGVTWTAEQHARWQKVCDLLVTSAGASVGEHDLVKDVLEELGMQTAFWRVRVRPGSPFSFGRIGDVAVFGLPGNPVAAFVTFVLIVALLSTALRWLLLAQFVEVAASLRKISGLVGTTSEAAREIERLDLHANARGHADTHAINQEVSDSRLRRYEPRRALRGRRLDAHEPLGDGVGDLGDVLEKALEVDNVPDGFRNETQVVITVLGADMENPQDVLGINAASASTQMTSFSASWT